MNKTRRICDLGGSALALNIDKLAKENKNFRTALWTGEHLQLTLMSIPVGCEIGAEMHPDLDQFLRVEDGCGIVMIGNAKDNLYYRQKINRDFAIFVPAGSWHNIINAADKPLKLYSVYSPPNHPFGTVHKTRADETENE